MGYGWKKLWDVDFTEAAWADAGTSTPGARTIGGKAAVIVNPSSNFLAAAAGVSVVSGTGLKFDTTACTTGPNDDLTHSLGAGVYWLFTTLVPSNFYPATIPGPEKYWQQMAATAIFDLTGCNGDGEGIVVGIGGNTTFGLGNSAGPVRTGGAVNGYGGQYAGTYASSFSTIAQLGMASTPDSAMVIVGTSGGASWFARSDGTSRSWPKDWYTQDKFQNIASVNAPSLGGSVIRSTSVLSVSVLDTAKTASLPVVKRLALWGRYPGNYSPMGPPAHHFVAA